MGTPLRLYTLDPDGVEFFVDWDQFDVGCSFFIPTVNTVEAARQVRKITRFWEWKVQVRACIENDIWGLRVWRTA